MIVNKCDFSHAVGQSSKETSDRLGSRVKTILCWYKAIKYERKDLSEKSKDTFIGSELFSFDMRPCSVFHVDVESVILFL